MSREWAQSQLEAGGMVNVQTLIDDKATETIVARSYSAPVLGDRVIIRLTSERLMPAEDLSMEFLGLEGKGISRPIAKQHRTALEFGHWALIHQPKYAKYALDLVKRMKGAARKAVSKAGHAWDLYVAMADELNQSVRHFLPAFWEQAARAYKEIGNTTYAGRALSKALEAERVHSLEVDREHRRDAILEFTLSGCLSGKALTEYAKDLEKQFPPLEAYETYKDLIIRRTMGGMAPTVTTATDLTRMIKAAKLEVNAEIEAVLESIITSPAMVRAPLQFWRSVKKQVANLVQRKPSFAVWLLCHTNAASSYRADSPVWEWIDLLEEWNVLPYLSMPASQFPSGVEIPGGRSGWFSRVASVETSPNKRIFDLLEQMADVIRDEKQPIQLHTGHYARMDVDLVDRLLALNIAIAEPPKNYELNFDGWFREEVDHPHRNSQLINVCSTEPYRTKFLEQFPTLVKFQGDRTKQPWGRTLAPRRAFEEAAVGHDRVKQFWWEFLDKQLTSLEKGGLADFEIAQEHLDGCCRAKTAEQFPALVDRLKKVDIAACLHRTLVAGILNEYGWDELDRVTDDHPMPQVQRYGDRKIFLAFPHLCWHDKDTLYWVSPTASSRSELFMKSGQTLQFVVRVGSQFAILYHDSTDGWKSYLKWSSDPNTSHVQPGWYFSDRWNSTVEVGSDGIFSGERTFREGDTVVPQTQPHWYHDGQRFWLLHGGQHRNYRDAGERTYVTEVDPNSGKTIRESVPPFFEESLPPGSRMEFPFSYLRTKPNQPGNSPLGEKDGLIGLRCFHRRDGAVESQGIDGRTWLFSQEEQPSQYPLAALAIINKPGSNAYWIAASNNVLIDSESRIGIGFFAERSKYFAGWPSELPMPYFFHLMRVRCEKTSQALRTLSRNDSDKLCIAGETEREARRKKPDPNIPDPQREETTRVATSLFPQAPPRLIRGLISIVKIAADEKAAIQNLLKRLEPRETSSSIPIYKDELAKPGFNELVMDPPERLSTYYYNEETLSEHIQLVAQYFSGKDPEAFVKCQRYWFVLLENLPGVAWKTFWKQIVRDDRPSDLKALKDQPWAHALGLLAHSGLLDLPGNLCLFRCSDDASAKLPQDFRQKLDEYHNVFFAEGKSRYIAYRFYSHIGERIYLLGHNPKGECKVPKPFVVDSTIPIDLVWKRSHLLAFIHALSKLDSLPLPSREQLDAAAHRLGLHPISVGMLWMGNVRTNPYGQEKLSKEVREHYEWKVKDIQIAVAELKALTVPSSLSTHCIKDPGYLLRKVGHNFESMVQCLEEARRALAPFPPELSQELQRAFPSYYGLPAKEFHELIMAPHEAELLKARRIEFKIPTKANSYNTLELEITPKPPFELLHAFDKVAKAIALINYHLPVGHSVRKKLPDAIEAIRAFVDNPETLLPVGHSYLSYDAQKANVDAIIAKLASTMGKYEKDSSGIYRCDSEQFLVATVPPQVQCFFRTSKLRSVKDLQRLQGSLQPLMDTPSYSGRLMNVDFAVQMRSEAMTRLVECNRNPQVQESHWEQNPLLSVPNLVEECAQALQLDTMSASLYLQILALPDPTIANIKRWNEWNTNQIQSYGAPLLERALLVEAKRERAGRDLFLPGGWEPLKAPNLPIETWKLPLFGYENTDRLRGGMAESLIVLGSIAAQFENAWNRWKSGEKPAYAEAPSKASKSKKK